MNEDDAGSVAKVDFARGREEAVRVVEEADMKGSEVGAEDEEVRMGEGDASGAVLDEAGEEGRTTDRGRRGPLDGSVFGRE